jgi:hypothetical protein
MKPIIGVAGLIADARLNVIFTVLTSSAFYSKIIKEISRVSEHSSRFMWAISFLG